MAGVALCDVPTCVITCQNSFFCGRRNNCATVWHDELHFSWQVQHFGELHRYSRDLVSPCFPLYLFLFPFSDGASTFPRVLSPFVSHCTPSCFPLLYGVSAFLRSCLLLSPLSPSLSSVLSPSLSLFLFPFVAGGFILHCPPSSVRLGVLNAFSCVRSCSWKDFLNPPTVWGLRRRNVLQVSRARAHLAQRYNVEQKDNNRNVKMCSAKNNRNNAWPMPMARC